MPEYFNHENYRGYSVTVSPVGWRRILRTLPYFVGDKVILDISTKIISEETINRHRLYLNFYEIHPDGHRVGHDAKENGVLRLTSNTITKQGDFAVYLGLMTGHDLSAPIFTAEIIHKDKRRYDLILLLFGGLLGAVLSCIVGILLGFIDIQEFWKIWIP